MNKYFISNAHCYKFALDVLEGEACMKLLKINYQHFTDHKKAKQWHDEILNELQQNGLDDVTTVEKLRSLYNEMI